MSRKKLIPVHSRAEIPHFADDDEAAAFWDTHEITEALLREAGIPRERGPAARIAALREKAGRQHAGGQHPPQQRTGRCAAADSSAS
jgi:hypothetical protein